MTTHPARRASCRTLRASCRTLVFLAGSWNPVAPAAGGVAKGRCRRREGGRGGGWRFPAGHRGRRELPSGCCGGLAGHDGATRPGESEKDMRRRSRRFVCLPYPRRRQGSGFAPRFPGQSGAFVILRVEGLVYEARRVARGLLPVCTRCPRRFKARCPSSPPLIGVHGRKTCRSANAFVVT